jgi:peptidoglycan/LPS O-acetylase OafA/YrhL
MTSGAPADQKPSGRYIAALDGIRGCSILALVVHGTPWQHAGPTGLGERIFGAASQAGWAGVQLFFVLSGFLITGILVDAKREPRFFRSFYARRALRIFPPYYAVLLLTLWVGPFLFSTGASGVQWILAHQAWLWTYTSNIEILRQNGWCFSADWLSLDHTWSLAVEEQFYLAWPLLVFLLPRRGLMAVTLGIIALSPFWRMGMLARGISPEVVYSLTLSRLDALAIGSLVALFLRGGSDVASARSLRIGKGLVFAGAIALGAIALERRGLDSEDSVVQTAGFSALAVLSAGLVLWAVVGSPESGYVRFLCLRPLRFVGRYSYGMYLYRGAMSPLFTRSTVDRFALSYGSRLVADLAVTMMALFGSLAIAFVSWQLFERRFLAYKARFGR